MNTFFLAASYRVIYIAFQYVCDVFVYGHPLAGGTCAGLQVVVNRFPEGLTQRGDVGPVIADQCPNKFHPPKKRLSSSLKCTDP